MAEDQSLVSEPLLPDQTGGTATPPTPSPDDNPSISTFSLISALLWILSIAALSVWAEVEASSTFAVTIINDAKHTSAGHRFALSYAYTDEATRILLNASTFVENFLYPPAEAQSKKHFRRVALRVTSSKSNKTAIIYTSKESEGSFIIYLSASVMENHDVDYALKSALLRAMARIWMYDGQSTAPSWLVDGMAEYVRAAAGFGNGKDCNGNDEMNKFPGSRGRWRHERACVVAQDLGYCEKRDNGYVRRLNQILKDPWIDRKVGEICSIHVIKYNKMSVEGVGSLSAN